MQKLQRTQERITAFSAAIHRLCSSKLNINQPIRKGAVTIGCGRALVKKRRQVDVALNGPAATCVIYATEASGETAVTFSKSRDFSLHSKNPTLL
jgi:hypothetical protein